MKILFYTLLLCSMTVQAREPEGQDCSIYTPDQAYSDLLSEPLKYVGRQAIPGQQNLSCIYKNSKVFVIHEGCRPTAALPLSVFFATIISREGGFLTTYIEANQRTYTLADASPSSGQAWKLISKRMTPVVGETWDNVFSAYESAIGDNSIPVCMKSPTFSACRNNGCDPTDNLNIVWQSPLDHNLKKIHDTIIGAPRK